MDGCQDITSGQYILIVSRPAETTGCFKKVWGKAFSLWQSERTSPGREPRGFHSSRALKDGESVRTVTAAARRTLYLSAAGKEWSNERGPFTRRRGGKGRGGGSESKRVHRFPLNWIKLGIDWVINARRPLLQYTPSTTEAFSARGSNGRGHESTGPLSSNATLTDGSGVATCRNPCEPRSLSVIIIAVRIKATSWDERGSSHAPLSTA